MHKIPSRLVRNISPLLLVCLIGIPAAASADVGDEPPSAPLELHSACNWPTGIFTLDHGNGASGSHITSNTASHLPSQWWRIAIKANCGLGPCTYPFFEVSILNDAQNLAMQPTSNAAGAIVNMVTYGSPHTPMSQRFAAKPMQGGKWLFIQRTDPFVPGNNYGTNLCLAMHPGGSDTCSTPPTLLELAKCSDVDAKQIFRLYDPKTLHYCTGTELPGPSSSPACP